MTTLAVTSVNSNRCHASTCFRIGYFIPNALKRQALGDRDKLVTNVDGSLDLYIQADTPGTSKEANWLPVAKAPFTLLMRIYSPRTEVVDGTWMPPDVRPEKAEAKQKVA